MTWWTSRASGACESLHEETVVQLIVLTALQRRSIQIQACTYIPAFLTSGIPLLRVLHSLFIFHLTVKYLSSTYWVLRCWRRWASWGRPSLSSCRPASWSVSSYDCSRMYLIIFQLLDFCFLLLHTLLPLPVSAEQLPMAGLGQTHAGPRGAGRAQAPPLRQPGF